jgi:hypothetical protein
LCTIVASGRAYSKQATSVEDISSLHENTVSKFSKQKAKHAQDSKQHTSEKSAGKYHKKGEYGKLYFAEGIDIHSLLKSKNGNKCFIEYVGIEEFDDTSDIDLESQAFMSGSKKKKFVTGSEEDFVSDIDTGINELYLSGHSSSNDCDIV